MRESKKKANERERKRKKMMKMFKTIPIYKITGIKSIWLFGLNSITTKQDASSPALPLKNYRKKKQFFTN